MIDRNSRQLAKTFVTLTCLVLAATGIVHFMETRSGVALTGGALLALIAVLKSNLVINDFLDFRHRGTLRFCLLAWPLFFTIAAFLRAVFSGMTAL